jgi:potassium efflux system protein
MGQVLLNSRQQLPDAAEIEQANRAREHRIADASLREIRFNEDLQRLRDLDGQVEERSGRAALRRGHHASCEAKFGSNSNVNGNSSARPRRLTRLTCASWANWTSPPRNSCAPSTPTSGFWPSISCGPAARRPSWAWTPSPRSPAAWPGCWRPDHWQGVLKVLLYEATSSPLFWLSLAPLIWLLFRGKAIKRAILLGAEPLRRVQTDSFHHTLVGLVLTAILLALRWPLLVAAFGWRLLDDPAVATVFSKGVGALPRWPSPTSFFSLHFLQLLLCMPGGVADRHFRWTGRHPGP